MSNGNEDPEAERIRRIQDKLTDRDVQDSKLNADMRTLNDFEEGPQFPMAPSERSAAVLFLVILLGVVLFFDPREQH